MPDISNYLVKDLKAELTRRRISHKSTAKKDELKALLQKQLDKEEGTKQMKEASSTSAASGSKATSNKTAKKRRREEEESKWLRTCYCRLAHLPFHHSPSTRFACPRHIRESWNTISYSGHRRKQFCR